MTCQSQLETTYDLSEYTFRTPKSCSLPHFELSSNWRLSVRNFPTIRSKEKKDLETLEPEDQGRAKMANIVWQIPLFVSESLLTDKQVTTDLRQKQ